MRSLFSNIYAVLIREFGRISEHKIHLMLMVVLPVLSFACFACIFSRPVNSLPMAVLDEDNTPLSRRLVSMVGQTPSAMVVCEIQDMEEGMRLMRQGDIYAVLQIPASFESDIMGNRQTHVGFYNSGCNISVNGLLAKDVQTAVTSFSVGVQLNLLQAQGLSERQAMVMARPVDFDKHVLFNPYINYSYYLAPSLMAMMLLIFTVLNTIFAVGSELKYSTAREWFDTAGGSVVAAVTGKLLPTTAVMMAMTAFMYAIIFMIMGAPLNGNAWFLLLSGFVFIISYQAIGLFVAALLANLRLALSFGGGYSVLAFTFSGLTFPVMAMYGGIRLFSYIFPFTFYMRLYVDIAMRGADAVRALPDLGAMLAFQILPLLVLRRLERVCTDERYWGKL